MAGSTHHAEPTTAKMCTDGAIVESSANRRNLPDALEMAALARTIESEIIPRLLIAHRPLVARRTPIDKSVTEDEITEFSHIVLTHDVAVASSFVDALRAKGITAETVALGLLTPTARHLGRLWEEDLCDFSQVTIALSKIQLVLNALGPFSVLAGKRFDARRTALLVPMPGEQHTLGILIVEEFFRSAGWEVSGGPLISSGELKRLVSEKWFAVVGISVSGETLLDDVATVIREIRRASCNNSVRVMVGGGIFTEQPEVAAQVGADATARDGREAVLRAQDLVH